MVICVYLTDETKEKLRKHRSKGFRKHIIELDCREKEIEEQAEGQTEEEIKENRIINETENIIRKHYIIEESKDKLRKLHFIDMAWREK